MKFEISEETLLEVNKWLQEVREQRRAEKGSTYAGAIGGEVTYSFTQTSLGQILVVTYFDKEKNFTDFENW